MGFMCIWFIAIFFALHPPIELSVEFILNLSHYRVHCANLVPDACWCWRNTKFWGILGNDSLDGADITPNWKNRTNLYRVCVVPVLPHAGFCRSRFYFYSLFAMKWSELTANVRLRIFKVGVLLPRHVQRNRIWLRMAACTFCTTHIFSPFLIPECKKIPVLDKKRWNIWIRWWKPIWKNWFFPRELLFFFTLSET